MTIKETARQAAVKASITGAVSNQVTDAVAVAVLREVRGYVVYYEEGAHLAVPDTAIDSMLAEFTPAPVTPTKIQHSWPAPVPPEPPRQAQLLSRRRELGHMTQTKDIEAETAGINQQLSYAGRAPYVDADGKGHDRNPPPPLDTRILEALRADVVAVGEIGTAHWTTAQILHLIDARLSPLPASEARPTTEARERASASLDKLRAANNAMADFIGLSPSPPPEVEQAKSLLNVAIGRWSHGFDAHIDDANRELDKAIDTYAAAVRAESSATVAEMDKDARFYAAQCAKLESALAAQAQEIETLFHERVRKELEHYAAKLACKALAGTLRTVYGRESSTRDDAASPVAQSADQVERVKALYGDTSRLGRRLRETPE